MILQRFFDSGIGYQTPPAPPDARKDLSRPFRKAIMTSSTPHAFSNLFRFSFLLSLSILLRCIFSAIFSYRSFSSLATLLSLMACIRRYTPFPPTVSATDLIYHPVLSIVASRKHDTYLSFGFLVRLHLLFLVFDGFLRVTCFDSFGPG